ncbi:Permease of the drug/metabolite transporter (DMT) superfamily [Streptoalloteichus tenebrarius]|uniref:Permease of the drug/metabolite transporter (DMT) superfamily n=1 Tax=Streptoalloteichus tenebrarius (strain ATCC 17920 / DSM 40477 / JCM 4838 / CBS 697.72 / NBRC 16177 / NCIMB 11028 / NRRL B-12390 / A12253. 1 / ISP 5477) TaxID=1933 RepID=A0ABT1HXA5_STRSD|nr:EamA family transporter [Streptoalloteichus tenebrarius]MCP2260157.1 Permease of the drug/metabolite transporter (DMT) superfamily [Streptoalloteichus tenebrarius]BFF02636.1 DMT family transporter [Streptoalloteichus tenebrarius]
MTSPGSLLRLGTLALLWGSSFLWIKLGLDAFSPVQLVLVRVALGAVVLVAICRARRVALPRGARVWGHLAVAGLLANALPFVMFGFGEQTVDTGLAGVLNGTMPLWTLLIALLVRQERGLGWAKGAGLALGFAGTLLIFAPWQSGGVLGWGSLAILCAALSYGLSAVYMARYLAGRGIPPVAVAAGQMICATAWTALAMPVGGLEAVRWNAVSLLAVAVLGVFGTGLAFIVYYRLIADDGPTVASTTAYLMPIVSVLLGAVVLHEELHPRVLGGMAVILVGVALTRVTPRRTARVEETPAPSSAPAPSAPAPLNAAPLNPAQPASASAGD